MQTRSAMLGLAVLKLAMLKLAVLSMALALGACAAGGGPATVRSAQQQERIVEVDHRKMAVVDHVARRKGVQVVWVNLPRRGRDD